MILGACHQCQITQKDEIMAAADKALQTYDTGKSHPLSV
jgi:hypothetical protein